MDTNTAQDLSDLAAWHWQSGPPPLSSGRVMVLRRIPCSRSRLRFQIYYHVLDISQVPWIPQAPCFLDAIYGPDGVPIQAVQVLGMQYCQPIESGCQNATCVLVRAHLAAVIASLS